MAKICHPVLDTFPKDKFVGEECRCATIVLLVLIDDNLTKRLWRLRVGVLCNFILIVVFVLIE